MKSHSLACLGERKWEFLQSVLNSILHHFLLNQKIGLLDRHHTRLSVYIGYSASYGYFRAYWEQIKAGKDRNSAGGHAEFSCTKQEEKSCKYFCSNPTISISETAPLKNPCRPDSHTSADGKSTSWCILCRRLQKPEMQHGGRED